MSGVFMVFVFIISARACSLGSSKNFRKLSIGYYKKSLQSFDYVDFETKLMIFVTI
jgi:hypothetical protein